MEKETPSNSEPQDHLSVYLEAELAEMRASWKALLKVGPLCPVWSWNQIEEVLLGLTHSPVQELVIRGALSALVKQSDFKPDEMVLGELFRLVRACHDQVLQSSALAMVEDEMP